jgi:large subunit ribosomal protein L24
MANIKKGDLVQVISGPTEARGGDRGKQGRVIEVLKEKNRVIVEGVNFVTKHVRVGQTQRGSKTGGIETHEAPIHVSNVALVDPDTKQPARVGFRVETDDNGKTTRVRYFKTSKRAENAKPAKAAKRRTEPVEGKAPAKKAAAKTDTEPATDSAAEKDTE